MRTLLHFLATVSFVFTFAFLTAATVSQISSSGVNAVLGSGGDSDMELVMNFKEPVGTFSFDIIGKIENFNVTSSSGPVNCSVQPKGISTVTCVFNDPAKDQKLVLRYTTNDFVKKLDNRFFFSADYNLRMDMDRLVVKVTLPETTALVSDIGIPGRLSFPNNVTTVSDGRRIIVIWQLFKVSSGNTLKFDILYESLTTPFWAELRIRYFLAFGVAAGLVVAFIVLRRAKKSEQLVLSVLDDFEKKVMDIVVANQGEVNQRKVVQETNLSKAKVSRVIKSLVGRGLVEVERLGRTNKLKLVKKKFKM